jgi:hypothetical protein
MVRVRDDVGRRAYPPKFKWCERLNIFHFFSRRVYSQSRALPLDLEVYIKYMSLHVLKITWGVGLNTSLSFATSKCVLDHRHYRRRTRRALNGRNPFPNGPVVTVEDECVNNTEPFQFGLANFQASVMGTRRNNLTLSVPNLEGFDQATATAPKDSDPYLCAAHL